MDEPQPPGVEALARQAGDGLFGPVHRVPQQGVADGSQVDPDLMGAACLQAALHMGVAGVSGQDGPMGDGLPAVFAVDRHFLPVHGVAADGGVYRAAVLLQAPHRHRLIGPGQGVVLELGGQGQVGAVVFGGDDEPGGVPVDAVDDAGPQLAVDSGQ